MKEAHLAGLPAKAVSQRLAQVHVVEVGQLVAHQADAGREIEGAGHGDFSPRRDFKADRSLNAERVKQADEGIRGLLGGVMSACDRSEPIAVIQANRAGDMAAPHIVNKDRLRKIGGHGYLTEHGISLVAYAPNYRTGWRE